MSENSYTNYQNMVTDVTSGIAKLDGVCRHLSMEAQADELCKIENRLKTHIFSVGVMGEFKRGKSTVINALLGQKIVPQNVVPCSATLNYVRWDTEKRAEVCFKDGTSTPVSVEELDKYVTKLTDESAKNAEKVDYAVVYYPCQFCQNGVQIVDTPGLNDDARMTEISERVIPTLDAIIMVITAKVPFSMSEAEFLRTKVMTSDMGRIIFILNQIDTVDEDEVEILIAHVKEKIQKSVLDKTAEVYGSDSKEYKMAKDKIGGIRLLPVSALNALKGITKNKPELYRESGYPEFEKALTVLLTEEKGLLELIHPVNQLISTGNEAIKIIQTRLDALNISTAEFEKIQKKSIETIEENRTRKKQEIQALKGKGKSLYVDLLPEVSGIYSEAETELKRYVEEFAISSDDIKDKKAAEALSEKIRMEVKEQLLNKFSVGTERLLIKIQDKLGNDVSDLEKFGEKMITDINDIRLSVSAAQSGGVGLVVKDALVDVGVVFGAAFLLDSFIPGVGGLVSGFREYGVKGAVVGGLTGAASAILVIGGLAAVGAASVAALPVILLGSLASTISGKAVTKTIFSRNESGQQKKIDKIKEEVLNAVNESINEARRGNVLEKWLKNTCDTMYSTVAENIDTEWENTLNTMEENLTQIKVDIEMNNEAKKKTEYDMKEYMNTINGVMETIKPIYTKLSAALNKGN